MSAVLELERVSRRFSLGRGHFVQAVDAVSLSVGLGEAVALVGESGCGKSTLARLINRLAPIDAGSIRLEGRDIGAIPPRHFARDPARAALQMVFQDATDSLDPHLTAGRAIAAPVQTLLKLGRTGTQARVEQAAGMAGLPLPLLARYPHQLSGGQKARVGIARALAPGRACWCWTNRPPRWTCRSRPSCCGCSTTSAAAWACRCCSSATTWAWCACCAAGCW